MDGAFKTLLSTVKNAVASICSTLLGEQISLAPKKALEWSTTLRHTDMEVIKNKVTRTRDTTDGYWTICLADIGLKRRAEWQIKILQA